MDYLGFGWSLCCEIKNSLYLFCFPKIIKNIFPIKNGIILGLVDSKLESLLPPIFSQKKNPTMVLYLCCGGI